MRAQSETKPLLEVKSLEVTFYTSRGASRAVRDATLEIHRGEVLGLVGESGCGKSTTAFAIMGYLPGTAQVKGSVLFEGENLTHASAPRLRHLRGNRIAMVYQDPATSLNPSMRIGPQIEEVLREHLDISPKEAVVRSGELFESVGLADPKSIGTYYPHQLSGGMQQRVVIAMALACSPDLLIMDEPTTGLDVTTEANILDLVIDLKQRVNAGILYVSHNLGVIARVSDRVTVMYAGQTVEQGSPSELFKKPGHPYTAGLMNCVPQPPASGQVVPKLPRIPGFVFGAEEAGAEACLFASRCPIVRDSCRLEAPSMFEIGEGHLTRCFFRHDVLPGIWGDAGERDEHPYQSQPEPVLVAKGIRRFYGSWRRKYILFGQPVNPPVRALVDVDFDVYAGRTLGIVGESGSGKTTAARAVVGLVPKNRGEMLLNGNELAARVQDRTSGQRAAMRMVFQNPAASLNPRLAIRHSILRSLRKFAGLGRRESLQRAAGLLEAVGLDPNYLNRLPSELSGGEQQRVALAGAFAANPDLIVADEAVSALDVSIQAQVLNLLQKQQREIGTSYIFISHDLGVVRYLSDDIMVLYAGHVAESGPAKLVLKAPYHPYTEALLSAAPEPDPDKQTPSIRLEGSVPTLKESFAGCFFAGRCPRKVGPICDDTPPPAQRAPDSYDHVIHCHIKLDKLDEMQKMGFSAAIDQ